MDGRGDQLLAAAVLAGDQHLDLRRRGAPHLGDELLDRRTATEDPQVVGGGAAIRAAQRGDVRSLGEHVEQVLGVDGLLDEVERATLERLDRRRDGALARDHDHRGGGRLLADHHQRLEPAHRGHVDVEEHRVEAALLERLERLHPVRGLGHLMAFVFEHAAQGAADL
jgi:hypothetical protein